MPKKSPEVSVSKKSSYIPKSSFIISLVLVFVGLLQLFGVYSLGENINLYLLVAAGVWFLFSSVSRGFASKRKALFKKML